MTTIVAVVITVLTTLTIFLSYMLYREKKEKMIREIYKKTSRANDIHQEEAKKKEDDWGFDRFWNGPNMKVNNDGPFRIQLNKVYPYKDTFNTVFYRENLWINDTATHNTKMIEEVTERVDVVMVAICKWGIGTKDGVKFVIEDVYGKITTEPLNRVNYLKENKQMQSMDILNDLQGVLVIFKGYAENGKFFVRRIVSTKIETLSS